MPPWAKRLLILIAIVFAFIYASYFGLHFFSVS
jgi:hypothetical protein